MAIENLTNVQNILERIIEVLELKNKIDVAQTKILATFQTNLFVFGLLLGVAFILIAFAFYNMFKIKNRLKEIDSNGNKR